MKKTLIVILVVALLTVMIPTMALAATTINVSTSAELATAIASATNGDVIYLFDGDYTLDQTTLNVDIAIIGESEDGVVITATGDTGAYSTSGGDTSGWLFLESGSLSISNLTMDGNGFSISQALRTKGALTVENVTIKNIEERQYFGFGIGVYQPGSLDATNVTMSNIERVGIHAKGDTDIDGFNYTGKGAITCLDYAIEVGTFNGSMTPFTVNVKSAVITDCLGVADDSAGSGSAALYINTYFYQNGGGITSLITVNIDYATINNSSVGLYVGYYEKGEYSDTILSNSNILNCSTDIRYVGLAGTSTLETVGNYFGGSAPTLSIEYGNTITGLDSYVTTPVPMNQDTDITAEIDPTFMIIIPAAVDFGNILKDTGVQEQNFPVEAIGVLLEPGCNIDVTVTSPFVMKDEDGAGSVELAFAMNNESGAVLTGNTFATFTGNDTEDGSIAVNTDNITMAGSYKGTLVFAITYEN